MKTASFRLAAILILQLAVMLRAIQSFSVQPTSILQIIDTDHIIISTSTTGKTYPYRRVQEE